MTIQELEARIANKEQAIAKLERSFGWAEFRGQQEKDIISRFLENGDRTEYVAYLRANRIGYGGDAWSKANDLYAARETLKKYQKQLEAETAKDNTLNNIPEVIRQFGQELLDNWNNYDFWKQQQIKADLRKETDWRDRENYRQFQRNMIEKWGRGYYDFAYLTHEKIIKNNTKAVDTLILNLVTRTVEIAGTIKDAKHLILDRDNNGYAIINGVVIGEKGKAKVESIGAGGYNIQRYHIRVLVTPIK